MTGESVRSHVELGEKVGIGHVHYQMKMVNHAVLKGDRLNQDHAFRLIVVRNSKFRPFISFNIIAQWTSWGSWNTCSASCGAGTFTAGRSCETSISGKSLTVSDCAQASPESPDHIKTGQCNGNNCRK